MSYEMTSREEAEADARFDAMMDAPPPARFCRCTSASEEPCAVCQMWMDGDEDDDE